MAKIKSVKAFEILDSRGMPTVETVVLLSDGAVGKSAVPSGASKGTYEALELRDNDDRRHKGKGVLRAVDNVNNLIGPKIEGIEAGEQQKVDKTMIEMDGTQNKSKLGANAILSVSQALVKAAANSSLLPLSIYLRQFLVNKNVEKKMPTPLFNLLEGGEHAPNSLDFQEFLVVPATSKKYKEALDIGTTVYEKLRDMLLERSSTTLYADEGGFAPEFGSNKEPLSLLKEAIESAGYKLAFDVFLGIDAAANSFKKQNVYKLIDRPEAFDQNDLVAYYKTLFDEYSLIYIEDPFGEEDWDGWKKMYAEMAAKTLIVGDDITTTNPYRLQVALENNVINGIIIKPNQVGTISETLAVVEMARYKNLKIIVSHRSGETMDDFIADFAVAISADYVKFGAPSRERVVKYNRLAEIQGQIEQV